MSLLPLMLTLLSFFEGRFLGRRVLLLVMMMVMLKLLLLFLSTNDG